MKIAAAVLTYNPVQNDRLGLLRDCIDSLKEADAVYLIDNGSTDGFDWPTSYYNDSGHTVCGRGTNLCARVLQATDADICVHSDDDMFWRPGWRARLEQWWEQAPEDVWLTGCHVEAEFPWNQIGAVVKDGYPIPALLRTSTGAASWSYRRTDFDKIFPIPEQMQGVGDVPACERIESRGGVIYQLDLAEHRSEVSTWGNRTAQMFDTDNSRVLELLK